MRTLVVAVVGLLGCTRGSPSPSAAVPEAGAPGDIRPAASTTRAAATPSANVAVHGRASLDCLAYRYELDAFLARLPTACKADGDCDGYYLGASACDAPVVLARPGCPVAQQPALERLQTSVRSACPPDAVVCSPRPFRAECRAGRCVDGMERPVAHPGVQY